MANSTEFRSKKLIEITKDLPYFGVTELSSVEPDLNHLKTFLSRYSKGGKVIRLKKGFYVEKSYLDNVKANSKLTDYLEFVASTLVTPSYLSLDYVLYKYGALTEIPKNYTCIALERAVRITNSFGNFFYHKIAKRLFTGYENKEENGCVVAIASFAKALFDYLYFRKQGIKDLSAFAELRLNLENFTLKDLEEFSYYIKLDGSKTAQMLYGFVKEASAKHPR